MRGRGRVRGHGPSRAPGTPEQGSPAEDVYSLNDDKARLCYDRYLVPPLIALSPSEPAKHRREFLLPVAIPRMSVKVLQKNWIFPDYVSPFTYSSVLTR